MINKPTTNDTGFHPAPGYLLVEIFMPDAVGKIVLSNRTKDERQPELEEVYVLEHNAKDFAALPQVAPGTRVLVKGGGLFNIVPGRKLSIVDEQDLLGFYA
jgi:hypothetical protein